LKKIQHSKDKIMSNRLKLFYVLFIVMIFHSQCGKICKKSTRCDLIPESGNCYAYMPRYYYDQTEGICKQFIWGGCDGVVPFETLAECEQNCSCE
jgi:hypothetical protein